MPLRHKVGGYRSEPEASGSEIGGRLGAQGTNPARRGELGMYVTQEYIYGAPSHCHTRESTKSEADSGIVATELPAEDYEIERYRSSQGRVPEAGQVLFL